MSFIVALVLSSLFLEWPWHLAVLVPAAALELLEIVLWLRWRKVRSITGVESIVGEKGRTITACDPTGQARVRGQIWSVTSLEPIPAHADVVVQRVDGIRLLVARKDV
jgi:membrane-bound serine protease (ClpP class)